VGMQRVMGSRLGGISQIGEVPRLQIRKCAWAASAAIKEGKIVRL
jgi:hypothetical protein